MKQQRSIHISKQELILCAIRSRRAEELQAGFKRRANSTHADKRLRRTKSGRRWLLDEE